MTDLFSKLVGTIELRWYTFTFLTVYLIHALRSYTWQRVALFTIGAYVLAWSAEFGSINHGFPFGWYHYIEATRDRELWVLGVPFFDSLSFVFLGYFSHLTACLWFQTKGTRISFALLAGVLMMLLDVIIDPLTLQGHKWFLGQIYYYPKPGPYFGVTLENFWGWFGVGAALSLLASSLFPKSREEGKPLYRLSVLGTYFGIAAFNIGIAFYINDKTLAWSGIFIMAPVAAHFAIAAKR